MNKRWTYIGGKPDEKYHIIEHLNKIRTIGGNAQQPNRYAQLQYLVPKLKQRIKNKERFNENGPH